MSAHRSPVGPRRPLLLAFAAACLLALPAAAHASTALDHITVSVSPAKATLGQPVTVTAIARAANNATISDYSGTADWGDTAGALDAANVADFVNGVSRTTEVLTKPVNGDVIAVRTAGAAGQSGRFSIVGPVDHFDVQLPGTVNFGTPVAVTATARDVAGNVVTSFADTAGVQDRAGVLAGSTAEFSAGVSHTSVVFSAAARGDQLLVGALGAGGTSRAFTVVGPVDHFDVSAPASATTSAAFTVTARARDALGSLVTTYNGSASWSDHTNNLSPTAPADFVSGVSTTSVTEPNAAHADVISVSGSGSSGSSKAFNIVGPYDHTDLAAVPASIHLGTPIPLIAYAHDSDNNVVSTFEGDGRWGVAADGETGGIRFVDGVGRTSIILVSPQHQARIDVSLQAYAGSVSTPPIDVIGPADHFELTWKRTDGLTGCTPTVTGSLRARAFDAADNFLKSYQNSNLTWASVGAFPVIPGTTTDAFPAPFVNGVSWSPGLTWLGGLFGPGDPITLSTNDGPGPGAASGSAVIC